MASEANGTRKGTLGIWVLIVAAGASLCLSAAAHGELNVVVDPGVDVGAGLTSYTVRFVADTPEEVLGALECRVDGTLSQYWAYNSVPTPTMTALGLIGATPEQVARDTHILLNDIDLNPIGLVIEDNTGMVDGYGLGNWLASSAVRAMVAGIFPSGRQMDLPLFQVVVPTGTEARLTGVAADACGRTLPMDVVIADSVSWDDFVLTAGSHLDVTTNCATGELRDSSTADLVAGGHIANASVNGTARLRVLAHSTGLSGTSVVNLRSDEAGRVEVIEGGVFDVRAHGSSLIDISGGWVYALHTFDAARADISGGDVSYINAGFHSGVCVRGGSVHMLHSYGDVIVTGGSISRLNLDTGAEAELRGGTIATLEASANVIVTLHGYDFAAADGLILDGDLVMGTGLLSGKWFDGTPWATDILAQDPTATIRIVPEPATLTLLAFGGVVELLGRRRGQLNSRRRNGDG